MRDTHERMLEKFGFRETCHLTKRAVDFLKTIVLRHECEAERPLSTLCGVRWRVELPPTACADGEKPPGRR